MIENLFSSRIWKTNLKFEDSIRKDILDKILTNFYKNESYLEPNWNCNVHTTIHQNNNVDYSRIVPYFKYEYEKFVKENNLKFHIYKIATIWYNYYLKGYNQEIHDHIGGDTVYSAVYFLKLNVDHPLITFYNYTNYHAYYAAKTNIRDLYSTIDIEHSIISPQFSLNVVENDFIIFPSYLPHNVFVQKTNEPRITISMNFTLEQNNGFVYQ